MIDFSKHSVGDRFTCKNGAKCTLVPRSEGTDTLYTRFPYCLKLDNRVFHCDYIYRYANGGVDADADWEWIVTECISVVKSKYPTNRGAYGKPQSG